MLADIHPNIYIGFAIVLIIVCTIVGIWHKQSSLWQMAKLYHHKHINNMANIRCSQWQNIRFFIWIIKISNFDPYGSNKTQNNGVFKNSSFYPYGILGPIQHKTFEFKISSFDPYGPNKTQNTGVFKNSSFDPYGTLGPIKSRHFNNIEFSIIQYFAYKYPKTRVFA